MSKGIVLSFYDYTGVMVWPWAAAGYQCYCFDKQHVYPRTEQNISYVPWDADDPVQNNMITNMFGNQNVVMVFGFPPCTDLASSGAKHWEKKRQADPEFQQKAVMRAKLVAAMAHRLRAPFMVENPRGALSTLWRKPDHRFHPYQYGGYLAPDDKHPLWPEYIPNQDAYTKETFLWTGGGFVMPPYSPVEPIKVTLTKANGKVTTGSPQWAKLGGKSLKTKNIRSATPRGFAIAVFDANANAYNAERYAA